MKITFTLLISIGIIFVSAQSETQYTVGSETLNMRSGPGENYTVIAKLEKGLKVEIISKEYGVWWSVECQGISGFVHSNYLVEKIDKYKDWDKKNYLSGQTPECLNITPQYDYDIDNYLKVNVGSGTDVVVKLMKSNKYSEDECFRIVYIRGGDNYEIKNIPEGFYYLKIAYGKDWRQTIEDNKCVGQFVVRPIYEKGNDLLDFYNIKKPNTKIGDYIYENWETPIYELFLDVITTSDTEEFSSDIISEDEFNK
ncbi:MAG: SH3 domain-containing protein [Chitinophagales bacterium]